MPNMPRILGDDTAATPDSHFGIVIRRPRPFPHYPTDRRRAQDETDTGEYLRHTLVSHCRAQALQLPNEVPDEVGVAVDRLNGLYERTLPWFVHATHPMKKRLQVDQENSGCRLQVPAPSGAKLEDSHPLDRGVVRPTTGSRPLPAAILNSKLFPKQRDFGGRLLKLGTKTLAAIRATAGDGNDDPGQRDGVQDPGFDVARPLPGQANHRAIGHDRLHVNCERSPILAPVT